jgi:hypothetical protein
MHEINRCCIRARSRTTVRVPTLAHCRREKSWPHRIAVQNPDADSAYDSKGDDAPCIRPIDITQRTWSHSENSGAVYRTSYAASVSNSAAPEALRSIATLDGFNVRQTAWTAILTADTSKYLRARFLDGVDAGTRSCEHTIRHETVRSHERRILQVRSRANHRLCGFVLRGVAGSVKDSDDNDSSGTHSSSVIHVRHQLSVKRAT